jgi:hypothetical protein
MKTLDIPGGSARFREKPEIKVRHRRMIESATIAAAPALVKMPADAEALQTLNVVELGLNDAEAQSIFALEDALIVATLIDWTRDEPIPDRDTIGDLDTELYDALKEALPLLGVLIGDVDFDPHPDRTGFEQSPTEPSVDSSSDLRAEPESESTTIPPSSGTSSSIGLPSQD